MIVGSYKPRKVGEILTIDLTDNKRNLHHDMRLYIIREATYQEYMDFCRSQDSKLTGSRAQPEHYFYEVSTD